MDNIAFIVTCMCCIQWVHCTKNPPPGDAVSQPKDSLGDWYAVMGNGLQKCVFPFTHKTIVYESCAYILGLFGIARLPWCSTVKNYKFINETGICTKVVNNVVDDVVLYSNISPGVCTYSYTKRSGVGNYHGIFYAQLKTYTDCQHHCNTITECRGVYFISSLNICYVYTGVDKIQYVTEIEVDSYSRRTCNTVIVNSHSTTVSLSGKSTIVDTTTTTIPSNTAPACMDAFTVTANTSASGGSYIGGATSLELCEQRCLAYDDDARDARNDFCVGFRTDETGEEFKCFVYINDAAFSVTNAAALVHLYTRHTCISKGNMYYYCL